MLVPERKDGLGRSPCLLASLSNLVLPLALPEPVFPDLLHTDGVWAVCSKHLAVSADSPSRVWTPVARGEQVALQSAAELMPVFTRPCQAGPSLPAMQLPSGTSQP